MTVRRCRGIGAPSVGEPGRRTGRQTGVERDRGASSIELVLYTPLLMFVIFLTVQFALTWHGNQIAGAVAREVAREARSGDGTAMALAQAEAGGLVYAAAIGGSALTDVTITVTALPADQEVSVTVEGRSVEIIGGFAPAVRSTVRGPLEAFRPDL